MASFTGIRDKQDGTSGSGIDRRGLLLEPRNYFALLVGETDLEGTFS
jgi:hypothetical protein